MKLIANVLSVGLLVALGYLFIDFDAKKPVPAAPKTPKFSQFMTCTMGENWSNENVNIMMDEWNDMNVNGMSFALGHQVIEGDAPVANDNQISWQLFWDNQSKAESFWKAGPSKEFKVWADKHRSVMYCDGEGRRNYDVDLPRPREKQGDWDGDTELVSVVYQCNFTVKDEEGNSVPMEDKADGEMQLKAMYSEFLDYVDQREADASWHIWSTTGKRGPYNFGVYTHNGENPDPYMDYDFYWMNYYETVTEAKDRLADWVNTGSDLQAKFDEFSTCEEDLIYTNSYVLYPDLDVEE
mgnify:CR=1 FL=1|tara:strand:+ start:1800 stop:2687 length:888 start_codon:yes stop_codon:yes gene_type:complete